MKITQISVSHKRPGPPLEGSPTKKPKTTMALPLALSRESNQLQELLGEDFNKIFNASNIEKVKSCFNSFYISSKANLYKFAEFTNMQALVDKDKESSFTVSFKPVALDNKTKMSFRIAGKLIYSTLVTPLTQATIKPYLNLDETINKPINKDTLQQEYLLHVDNFKYYSYYLQSQILPLLSNEKGKLFIHNYLTLLNEQKPLESWFMEALTYWLAKNNKALFICLNNAVDSNRENLAAITNLAYCYMNGIGIDKDVEKALNLYSLAAIKENSIAQVKLGEYYQYGIEVAEDLHQAFQWYIKAAEQGNPDAQASLGDCYMFGIGVAKNLAKAVEYYTKAAKQGNSDAQTNLGNCYQNSVGIEENLHQAFQWYTKAAAKGNSDAQASLGDCYMFGIGVAKSLANAFKWYTQAAYAGIKDEEKQDEVFECLQSLYSKHFSQIKPRLQQSYKVKYEQVKNNPAIINTEDCISLAEFSNDDQVFLLKNKEGCLLAIEESNLYRLIEKEVKERKRTEDSGEDTEVEDKEYKYKNPYTREMIVLADPSLI